jgi:hypothetical protein
MEPIKARFFGRKKILEDLVQGLLAPHQPLDFSLVGPKMIGKSRLLKYLASPEGPLQGPDPLGWRPERFQDGSNVIVGHYDCDWPAAQSHLTEFIYQSLRMQLEQEKQLGLNWLQVEQAPSPGQKIDQVVRQLEQQEIRLVLILDNFDHVLRSDRVTPDMVNELRPLTSKLGLVVATEEALHDLNQSLASSPLFNVMHQHFVGLLEPDAAHDWIAAYSERQPLIPAVTEALLKLTGGHPFLLARVNDILLEVQNGSSIDEQRLPLIRLRLAEHGRQLFETIWRRLQEGRGQATLPLVKQLIHGPIQIGQMPAEQVAALNWLINQAIVTYDKNCYYLFSPLLGKFLVEQMGLNPPEPAQEPEGDCPNIFELLAPKEAELLRYFQANSRRVISIEQLLTDVWNQPATASPRRVQEAIRRLRNSLNKQTPPIGVIENERGLGYRYIPT